jgi:DNA-binding transcriptional ArsR family regulator
LWAFDEAPVSDPTRKLVLLALADEAGDDGKNAMPSVKTLARRACVDTSTVKRHLKALEKEGLIAEGDQTKAARYRADRRPKVWDLDMTKSRDEDTPDRRHVPTRAPKNPRNQFSPPAEATGSDSGRVTAVLPEPVTSDDARGGIMHPRESDDVSRGGIMHPRHEGAHDGAYGGAYEGASMPYDPRDPYNPRTRDDDEPLRGDSSAAVEKPSAARRPNFDGRATVRQLADSLVQAQARSIVWDLTDDEYDQLHAAILDAGDTQPFVDYALSQDASLPAPGVRASAYVRAWLGLHHPSRPGAGSTAPSRPDWCGTCESAGYRFTEDDQGRAVRCPRCNPPSVAF